VDPAADHLGVGVVSDQQGQRVLKPPDGVMVATFVVENPCLGRESIRRERGVERAAFGKVVDDDVPRSGVTRVLWIW